MPTRLLRRFARLVRYWEIRRAVVDWRDEVQVHAERAVWRQLALLQRRRLRDTVFIAITGSVGKTTATDLTAGALAREGDVARASHGINQPALISQAIARTRKGHRFAVFEVGVGKQGQNRIVERSMELIRPSISVVTTIGDDHISAYGSREAIAREKGKIVAAIPPNGVAVLNADDPLVLAMRERCRGRVLTYGRGGGAAVRAENVASRWPDRLAFDVVHEGSSQHVVTQLCGEHWVTAALAATAACLAAGMTLPAIADALRSIPPAPQRMFPVERDDGITFVRDDAKSPLWTMPAALSFLANAGAARKILVVGTLSDYAEHRPAYVSVARQARDVADHVIFFGQWAWNVDRERNGRDDARLLWFNSFEAAKRALDALLRPGDLVLLKGQEDDRMERFLERAAISADARADEPEASTASSDARPPVVVVGLGNPGERYRATRHNVGHAVVERLAVRFDARWDTVDGARVARVPREGSEIVLVKLDAQMNVSGPALRRVETELALRPERTILVHDEVKLEPGRVRGRIEGGDGGHLGARSVLSTFEDHRFRRVKVGVGAPPAGRSMTDHVLGAFADDERERVERALETACGQVLLFADEIAAAGRSAG